MSNDNRWELRGISADLRRRVILAATQSRVTHGVWVSQALESNLAKLESDLLAAVMGKLNDAVTRIGQATAALQRIDERVEVTVRRTVEEALAERGLGSTPPVRSRRRAKV